MENKIKLSIIEIQKAIDILRTLPNSDETIFDAINDLSYTIADLEFKLNS